MDKLSAARDGLLIAAMFAIAIWTNHQLPGGSQVAIHWGPDGQPDAWVGAGAGLLVIPLVACVLWFLLSFFPRGFSSPGKFVPVTGARRTVLSRVLLIQLAAQVLVAMRYLG